MGRNIDDDADDNALEIQSAGENYHDEFLDKRPKTEWCPYIDETATDLSSGTQISTHSLTKDNFGQELGIYYRQGLNSTAGRYADLPAVLKETVTDAKLGLLAYQLNKLSYDISTNDRGIADVETATQAILEKLLTRLLGEDLSVSFDLTGGAVADLTTQLCSNETIASNVDRLLAKIEISTTQDLLSLLDEPQMMTPLWAHQRDALETWWGNDKRGYVEMATGTGKTVLGLGAIALQFGTLHPTDQAIGDGADPADSPGSEDVLIVAHSDLSLEQWRREFEKHLNIPQARTTGSNDIDLEWGTIHFRTSQALLTEDQIDYDLALLDEAHQYVTGSEWGLLLEEFDGNVLAMAGAVDDTGSDSERINERLSYRIGPELKRYTVADARSDGVIPTFDWEIHYAPYVVSGDLDEATERAEESFQEFHNRFEQGDLVLGTDRRIRTFGDVRRFSHTPAGTALKQDDEAFRDLVIRLCSRRTNLRNRSPTLDTVVDLVGEHHRTEKVVVFADSNAQVQELESRITDVVGNPASVYCVSGSRSRDEQRETIEEFDGPDDSGVLIGTGDLLGEGVEMQHASVAINLATGGVNQERVQRIGRILRNPEDTPEPAMVYHVVGVPPTEDAAIPREDGKQIIEQAAEFCSLGRRFDQLPGFALSDQIDEDVLGTLLEAGALCIDSLDADGEYAWDKENINQDDLRALHDAVQAADGDVETILAEWEAYAREHSEENTPSTDETDTDDETGTTTESSQPDHDVEESGPSDAETLAAKQRNRIEDLVELQPTTNAELQDRWGLAADSDVEEYLQAELTDYYVRDSDGRIRASEQAEALETGDSPTENSTQSTSNLNTETDDASSEATGFWDQDVDPITEYEDEEAVSDEPAGSVDTLDKRIDEWKSQLLDLTRRNKLVSFNPTKTKDLPFEDVNPTAIADEIDGDGELYIRKRPEEADAEDDYLDLATNELLPTRPPDEASNSLSQIALTNKQYLRERGVDSLYLSLGILRWYSVDNSDKANRSPLFLTPVELEEKTLRDDRKHNYILKLNADGLRLNPALRKKLAGERGITLPADTALSLAELDAAFEAVNETLRGFDRWEIQPDTVLGIFDFTKYSLYSDLERNRERIKDDPIIQALDGNMEPLQQAEGDITSPSAAELDDVVDPIDTYQVLDADSSQQEAIEAAKRGKSFVLQGPPGTGKSQTIANIISEKLAAGERVLFVSEKQAALDVVKNRLDDVGLGRFCLEVHGEKATNTDVLGSLEDELKAPHIKPAEDRTKQLSKLRERRDTINQYGDQLFHSPDGWDLTAYQAFGIVSKHADAPRIDVDIAEPLGVGQKTLETGIDELATLARFDEEIDTYETSPWRHTTLREWGIDTGDSMRQSLRRQVEAIAELQDLATELDGEFGLHPDSLTEFRVVKELLAHVSNRPEIDWQAAHFEEVFIEDEGRFQELAALEQEREALIDELSECYEQRFFAANGAELNSELDSYGLLKILRPSYRSLKRKITTHTQPSYNPSYGQLLDDTRKLAELQRIDDRRDQFDGVIERLGPLYEGGETDWESLTQAQQWVAKLEEYDSTFTDPIVDSLIEDSLSNVEASLQQTATALESYDDAAAFFERAMNVEAMKVDGVPFRQAPLSDLWASLETLQDEVDALQRRVQFSAQLDAVRDTVCEEYVDRFLLGDYNSDYLVPAFKKRFYTKWLNSIYEQTDLGSFSADEMERYVEDFRRLDREQQELAKVEIQHEVTNRRPSLDLEHASSAEQVRVRREAEKQRKHKPLRELFDDAGSFITQLTPCFMMSPLSVAQYLKADSIQFDTVVFDEASQIMPHDAISSLIRADQSIIAGDTKQLPPTSFFQSDIDTTSAVREDLDSILEETASVLSEKTLRWHYRSRSEELIQFSNYHYYNNSLRTFPENDPNLDTGVDFEYVEDGVYDRGGSRQNEVEARRVVDLIEEHAEERSDKSLGVVAFSSAQEQAIRDALAERREESSVLDSFVSQDDVLSEFFIKNLEMVQGDERDRMIFSVGYGPDQDGTISTNFGPLNQSGGERRLNVAVTRAKEHITVVCSMLPSDIDLSSSNSIGAKHFKHYLEYARKGEQALDRADADTETLEFDSQFEEAVYDRLQAEGYDVVSQGQRSSYSIDLALKHPDQPEKFMLGIECDGAAYHSSKTARDRDRTRQMVLEDLGWTIHRIWSPDWASNPDREIRKINEKVQAILTGNSVTSGDPHVPSYEPEVFEIDSKVEHEEISEYQEPSLPQSERYNEDKHGQERAYRNSIRDTVLQYGPLSTEAAIQVHLDVRNESRAGSTVRESFRDHLAELQNRDHIVEHDDFLWPNYQELDFTIRVNTDAASRPIDEIPREEIGKAITVILEAGGAIEKEDIVLETTRLFGYQRRGSRIESRINDALLLLESEGVIQRDEKITLTEESNRDSAILSRVYPSLSS